VVAQGGRRSADDRRAAVAAGIAAARERGVRLGRPATPVPAAGERVKQLRADGKSLAEIAELLNAEAVPSASGRPWTKASVQYVVRRLEQHDADETAP
jgi:DNA invertase Pin-like site-specific DNA recombinase